ncbi:MAG: leucyl aminopeptidase, partial [Chlamydiales bacterium]
GKRAKEELWELPLGKGFRKQLDSQIADIKNDGINHYGASSVAAEFLHEFIDEGVKFAHLDISGVAWNPFAPEKGVTGYGVHLLTEFIV